MAWKIEYKRYERFLYGHSNTWPLKNIKILKRINELKKQKSFEGSCEFDEIVLGDDELFRALNIQYADVGEFEELKTIYLLCSKYKSIENYQTLHHSEDKFSKAPLHEQNNYSDLEGIEFDKNENFELLDSSVIRVTESFMQVSFRFIYSETFKKEFLKVLTEYKESEFQILDTSFKRLFKTNGFSIIRHDNSHLTQHAIAVFLEDSRQRALEILGKKITSLHIGSLKSAFSLFVFAYKISSNEDQVRENSFSRRLYLHLDGTGLRKYSDPEDKVMLLYEVGEYKSLAPNSEMVFFNQSVFSDKDIVPYGGELRYLIRSWLRLEIEISITMHLAIITILLDYYSMLTMYRFTKYKSYTRLSLRRYERFLRETHFYRAFIDEYSLDEKDMKAYFKSSVYNLSRRLEKGHTYPLNETIFYRIKNRLSAIHALEKQISSIVTAHKDISIVKSNWRLSLLVVILTIISVFPNIRFCLNGLVNYISIKIVGNCFI